MYVCLCVKGKVQNRDKVGYQGEEPGSHLRQERNITERSHIPEGAFERRARRAPWQRSAKVDGGAKEEDKPQHAHGPGEADLRKEATEHDGKDKAAYNRGY